jgi:hypothetical protein
MNCRTCKKPHPSSLHKKPQDWDNQKQSNNEERQPATPQSNNQSSHHYETKPVSTEKKEETKIQTLATKQLNNAQKLGMITPVYITTDEFNSEILVYALLDTQSDSCFISREVAAILRPKHVTENVSISTLNGVTDERVRKYQNIHIRGYYNADRITVDAYERQKIPCDRSQIPDNVNTSYLHHLEQIRDQLPPPLDAPIGLLIGTDCTEALAPIASIKGDKADPFAVKTILGWTVCGGTNNPNNTRVEKVSIHVKASTVQASLDDTIPTYLSSKEMVSQDDLMFIEIMDKGTIEKDNGSLEMPLPFKTRPVLPNNRIQAEKRLDGLKRKFAVDNSFKMNYEAFMNDLISRGHAEIAPEKHDPGKTWYIPHFAVTHPKKNKIRVVFDCSAKFQDVSLNDQLLQGPDMMNSLVGILCRFRMKPVAITCDVEKMFYNFYVQEQDRDYLRFLWYDTEGKIVDYRMTVHLFGASSSPAVATYGLRKLAELKKEEFPEAAAFINRNFYVDDGIISVESADSAIKLIEDSRQLCGTGNLRLHKFICNNQSVMQTIPSTEKSAHVDLFTDNLPTQRTLGLEWAVDTDILKFNGNALTEKPQTRRGLLSVVSQLFDPLGLLSPFTLIGKNILHKVNAAGLDWNADIGPDHKAAWSKWKEQLDSLQEIQIPRCVKPGGFGLIERAELHHFSDASELGIGACSYLRVTNDKKEVHTTLLLGKSKVIPSNGVYTIPRLELMGAVQAVRLSLMLRKELDMKINQEYFWTDSKIVLGYIANDSKRFHVFVANRVSQIRANTSRAMESCTWRSESGGHSLSRLRVQAVNWFYLV